jgi:hypothetical protein
MLCCLLLINSKIKKYSIDDTFLKILHLYLYEIIVF